MTRGQAVSEESTLVIGIGNECRQDDAAGLAALRCLQQQNLEGVRLAECDGEPAKLLDLWRGATNVILIDAVSSGAAPGTIHWFDVENEPLPSQLFQISSHGLGVGQAIELGRALNYLPPILKLYGIEGKNFGQGEGLSAEVAESIPAVASCIQEMLRELKREAHTDA